MLLGTARNTREGILRVDLDAGGSLEVLATADQSTLASTRVVIAINAEDLSLVAPSSAGPNCLSGEVDHFAYLGSHSDATIRLTNAAVRVRIPKGGHLQIGQEVGIVFPPDRVRLFRV